jgi:hypothetical protein
VLAAWSPPQAAAQTRSMATTNPHGALGIPQQVTGPPRETDPRSAGTP